MKFTLNITQEILDKAKRCDSTKCAFAEVYGQLVSYASVGTTTVTLYAHDIHHITIPLTLEQARFVCRFDLGLERKPTSFEVEIPDEFIDYLYSGHVDVAQKLADSKTLIPHLQPII